MKPKFNGPVVFFSLLVIAFIFWQLRFAAILLMVSFIVTVILLPLVRFLKRFKIPAAFAMVIPILVVVGGTTALGFYLVPELESQFSDLVTDVTERAENLNIFDDLPISAQQVQDYFSNQLDNIGPLLMGYGTSFVVGLTGLLMVIVISLYWLSSYDRVRETLTSYFPSEHRDRVSDIWDRIETKLGKWFVGQVLVSTIVGVMTWIAALILGLPYAGVLGLIAGLLEIIPSIGPIIASIPAILLGLSESVQKGIVVAIVYIVIQQIESQAVSPLVMGRTVKLHPIVIIISLLIGHSLFGLVGAFFSVPGALVVSAVVDSYRNESTPAQNTTGPSDK